MRKRILALVLVLIMVLGTMTGCGKMPKFNSSSLTEAQSYVKAAMADYEIHKNNEFKDAKVLLTDDLKADLAGTVDIEAWDVSDIKALVLVTIGPTEGAASETSETAAADSAAVTMPDDEAEGKTDSKTESKTSGTKTDEKAQLLFLMDGSKDVIDTWTISTNIGVAADDSGTSAADLLSQSKNYTVDRDDKASVKMGIAIKELAMDNMLAEKPELAEAAAALETAYKGNKGYLNSEENIKAIDANADFKSYEKLFGELKILEEILAIHETKDILYYELEEKLDVIESDEELFENERTIVRDLIEAKAALNDHHAANKAAVDAFLAQAEPLKSKDDYINSEAYVKLCIASEVLNTYDNLYRQVVLYEDALATIEKARATADVDEREYIINRGQTVMNYVPKYVESLKTHVQCIINQETFKSEKGGELAAYDKEVAAAKKAAGSDYKNDVDYLKVELKYKDITDAKSAHESAVKNSKAAVDSLVADRDAALEEMDAEEKERKQEVSEEQEQKALKDFVSADAGEVSEYDAEKGQFGYIHPDYAAWQNQNLNYYVPKTSYSSSYSSGKKYSSSSGSSGGYDYDKGYGYTAPNPGESLSDYIKRQDPDLYNSITGRYNTVTGQN